MELGGSSSWSMSSSRSWSLYRSRSWSKSRYSSTSLSRLWYSVGHSVIDVNRRCH
jgi:hypothetical protein